MANEVVKYDNRINNVAFTNFTANELDIFLSICSVMKEKGEEKIELSFEKLRQLTKYTQTSNSVFVRDLNTTYDKLISTKFSFEPKKGVYTKFVLFTKYTIDTNNQTVQIAVNSEFKELLNEITKNFTHFELEEFTQISGTYPKQLYRLLKQWKTTGLWEVQIDEFRRLMDIPEWYQMTHIDARILKPSIKELRKLKDFENLRVTKKKAGRKINKLIFEFNEWVQEIIIRDKSKHKTKKKYIDQRVIIKATDYNEDIVEKPPTEKFIDMFKIHKIMKFNIGKGTERGALTEIEFNNLVDTTLEKLNLQSNEVIQQIEQLREDYVLKTEIDEEQLTFDIE